MGPLGGLFSKPSTPALPKPPPPPKTVRLPLADDPNRDKALKAARSRRLRNSVGSRDTQTTTGAVKTLGPGSQPLGG